MIEYNLGFEKNIKKYLQKLGLGNNFRINLNGDFKSVSIIFINKIFLTIPN